MLEDTDMGYELIKGESAHVSKGSPQSELSWLVRIPSDGGLYRSL